MKLSKLLSQLAAAALGTMLASAGTADPTALWGVTVGGIAPSMGNDIVATSDALYTLGVASTVVGDGGSGYSHGYTDPTAAIYFGGKDGAKIATGAPYEGSGYNNNFMLVKTDLNGKYLWSVSSSMGESASGCGNLAPAPDGGVYVTVKLRHTDKKNADKPTFVDAKGKATSIDWTLPEGQTWRYYQGLVMKVSSEGTIEWTRLINVSTAPVPSVNNKESDHTSDAITFYSMQSDNDGNMYVSGLYSNPMTFTRPDGSTVTLTPHNTYNWNGDAQDVHGDLFVVKLDPNGYLLKTLVTTGRADRESMAKLSWANKAKTELVLNAVVSGSDTTSTAITFGNLNINLPDRSPGLLVAKIDTELNVQWANFVQGARILNHTGVLQFNHAYAINDNVWLTGMGNFSLIDASGNSLLSTATSNVREAYLIKADATNGAWKAGVTSKQATPSVIGISGYAGGGFEGSDGAFYTIGYNFGGKGVILTKFNEETLACDTCYSLILGGGMPTVQAFAIKGDTLYTISRGRVQMDSQRFQFINNTDVSAPTASDQFTTLIAAFKLPVSGTQTAVQTITAPAATSVYGATGTLHVVASKPAMVNVYNVTGSLVARVNAQAGDNAVSLPAGIYIVAGKKAVVR